MGPGPRPRPRAGAGGTQKCVHKNGRYWGIGVVGYWEVCWEFAVYGRREIWGYRWEGSINHTRLNHNRLKSA